MHLLKELIQSRRFLRAWDRFPEKFTTADMGLEFGNGFQILERILSHGDLQFNSDCFLYRNGEQISRRRKSMPNSKRLSPLDGNVRSFIESEIMRTGASFKIDQVSRFDFHIAEIVRSLSSVMGVSVSCNLYYTPAYSKCFQPHVDPYHIFIFQLAGRKHWNLSKPDKNLSPKAQQNQNQNARFDRSEILNSGDALYLPKNALHEAFTTEQSSIHLTFGFHPINLNQYIRRTLEFETSHKMKKLGENVFLSGQPQFFSEQKLTVEHIDKLTTEFRRQLMELKDGKIPYSFCRDHFDLAERTSFPLGIDIFPDTEFHMVGKLSALHELNQPKPVLQMLRTLKSRKSFRGGELTLKCKKHLNWKQSQSLLRKLLENQMIDLSAQTKSKSFDSEDAILKANHLHSFFDSKGVFWLFKLGEKDGFLSMKPKQAQVFFNELKKNSNLAQAISQKLTHGQ